jgi:hypothetical protein
VSSLSQLGDRDFPSQLGGGGKFFLSQRSEASLTQKQDLDGDLYDIFWDERIMSPMLFLPAETLHHRLTLAAWSQRRTSASTLSTS